MSERILYEACPLCASQRLARYKVGNCRLHPLFHSHMQAEMVWMQCADCAHVFTEGYYTESMCRLIFSRTNEHQQVGNGLEQQRWISARMVEKVLPYVASGRWLDVGFGNASLLFTAQEFGFDPVGLDLREESVQKLRDAGVEAHCESMTTVSCVQPCSVISLADVLEHMPDPREALTAAQRLLADNGVLFISLPNIESMVWKQLDLQGTNPFWGELEHYHNFSRSRLYAFLREFGFEPLRYGISERYRACMEIIACKQSHLSSFPGIAEA